MSAEKSTTFSPVRDNELTIAYRRFSYWWSTVLLMFCLFVIYYDIAKDWVNDFDDNGKDHRGNPKASADDTPVAVNIILFTVFLFWVALLEGAQVSIVGLSTCDIEVFKESHPRSYAVCKLVHKGANVERFIVGRQFLLLFIVFLITRVGGHSADRVDQSNNGAFYIGDWDWHEDASLAFMENSILLMIVIIIPGQLVSQLIAAGKMLDFLELPYAPLYTVAYPSLALEWLGFTHCAYVIKDLAQMASGVKLDAPGKEMKKTPWFILRCVCSTVLVIFSCVVFIKGTIDERTNVWDTLPAGGALALSFFFLFFIGCCEGFQIAAVTLSKLPSSELKEKYSVAYKVCQKLFAGRNLQAFLVGRQVFVAIMMVLLGRVTSFNIKDDCMYRNETHPNGTLYEDLLCVEEKEFWGFNEWAIDGFLNTGFLGAIFVVNVGCLSFRMMASCFPAIFINNYVLYGLLRIALLVEATGVVNACWPLAWGLDACFGCKKDSEYLEKNSNIPANNVLDRKESMGIPVSQGAQPYDLHQPEQEFDGYYKLNTQGQPELTEFTNKQVITGV